MDGRTVPNGAGLVLGPCGSLNLQSRPGRENGLADPANRRQEGSHAGICVCGAGGRPRKARGLAGVGGDPRRVPEKDSRAENDGPSRLRRACDAQRLKQPACLVARAASGGSERRSLGLVTP